MTVQAKLLPNTEFSIHPATRPGHVSLTVADLDRQVEFYREVIGLKLHWRDGATAGLGVGNEDLLRLTEVRGARRYRGTTGLYHFAILLPNRRELARAIGRLFTLRYPNYPTELEPVVERIRQAGVATEQTEAGLLVRDPSRNGVLLTTRLELEHEPDGDEPQTKHAKQ